MLELISIFLVLLFYSTGNFGLVNIFGIRRELQIFLLLGLSLASLLSLITMRRRSIAKEPLFWLALCILVSSVLLGKPFEDIRVYYGIFIVVLGFYLLSDKGKEKVLRWIIICSTVFALAAIIQAISVIFDPGLGKQLQVGYSSDSNDAILQIVHPFAYFGFTMVPIQIFNSLYWRFVSFSTEPSVLIYLFVTPGFLALMYGGTIRNCAYLLLGFPFLFSFSSTTYIIILFSVLLWMISHKLREHKPSKKSVLVITFIPFIIGFMFLLFVWIDGPDRIVLIINHFTEPLILQSQGDVFDKSGSGWSRIWEIQKIIANMKFYPIGSLFILNAPVSMLISNYFIAGIGGIVLSGWVLFSIQKLAYVNLYSVSSAIKLASSGIISILIIILTYSDYGWRSPAGYLMLGLMKWKMEQLTQRESTKEMH